MNKIGLNKNSATSVEHKLKLIENELLKEQNSILRLSSSLYSIKVSNKSEIDRTRQVLKSMLNSIQRDLHMIRTFKARYHKFIRDIINYDKKMAMQINKDYNTYYNTKKLGHLKIENNYKVLSYNELGRAYSELQDEKEGGIFSFNDIRERAILNQYPSYMKYNYLLHYDTINSDNKLNYYWGKIKYTGKGLYARTFGILESEEENFLRAQGFNEYYSKLGAGIVSGECGVGMIASSIRSVGVLKNYKCVKQGTISFMGSGELSKVGKDTVEVEKAAKALEQTKGPKDIGNAAKTSYVKSIANLKNTENFTEGALEHILEGQINKRGKAVGFHYEGFPTAKGKIIDGTKSIPNDFGVYTGKVEVGGVPKISNGGKSTFFPEGWTAQEVIDAINQAFNNKEFVQGTRNTYRGKAANGLKIEMYIDNATNKIISAFPK